MQTITYFKITPACSPWNFMRWLRLILGIYVGIQAIMLTDALAGLILRFLSLPGGYEYRLLWRNKLCHSDSAPIR
jgi:hypothetical protein